MIRTTLAVCLLAANLAGANAAVAASEWEGSTNALCRSLIEQRDYAVFEEGRKAAVAIISAAARSRSLPEAAERPSLMDVLQRQRDDLAAAHAALAARSAQEPELAAEWHLFLGTGAQEIDLLDRRIEALASGRLEPHLLKRDAGTGTGALEEALAALGSWAGIASWSSRVPVCPPMRPDSSRQRHASARRPSTAAPRTRMTSGP